MEPALEEIKTIMQKGVDFEVTSGRKARKFVIRPIYLGTLFEISEIILGMTGIDDLDKEDMFATGVKNIIENKNRMLNIVALAIINREMTLWQRFRKWRLVKYLDRNLDASELLKLIQLVILQMDVTNFLACSVSVKRINLVGTAKEANEVKASS